MANAVFSQLLELPAVRVKQRVELAELFGYETRNKYSIESEDGTVLLYGAEQQKGFLGFFFRQALGHWRTFDILIFDNSRAPVLIAKHPFRFYFQQLEILQSNGSPIGTLRKRFSIFSKKFDVLDAHGQLRFTVNSPIYRIWTFPFKRDGQELACVKKQWAGIFQEGLLDADNFRVEFKSASLTLEERLLLVTAGIFIDLQYFERKARTR